MKKIGKFIIEGEVGRGGMGIVYKGRDPDIGRTVAVKTLHFESPVGSEELEKAHSRFLREARSAGNLSHPNIVTIYEVGQDQDNVFIAMEYVEGHSLESLLASGRRFSPEDVLALLEPLASALDYAHGQGVIHRDIKPANILIDSAGQPHLVDFGIARITASATQTKTIMGTPYYMSPEQISGKSLDNRSDLYSLGVVAYEMLTGVKPFPGEDVTTVIYRIMYEAAPPLVSMNPSLPPGLDHVLHKALDKSPGSRFSTCLELVHALRNHQDYETEYPSMPQPVSPPAPTAFYPVRKDKRPRPPATKDPRRRMLLIVTGMMLSLAVLITVIVILYKGGSSSGGFPIASGQQDPPPVSRPDPSLPPDRAAVREQADPSTLDTAPAKKQEDETNREEAEGPETERVTPSRKKTPAAKSQSSFEDEADGLYRAKSWNAMKTVVDQGLQNFPESAKLWSYQSAYYYYVKDSPGREDQALRATMRAAELDPANPDYQLSLGAVLVELHQNYEEALSAFRRAEALGETNPLLSFWMGVCAERLFRYEEAGAEYRSFLQADPFGLTAPEALRGLARLKRTDPSADLDWVTSEIVWRGEPYFTILIDEFAYDTYPAVFVSLDKAALVPLPPSPESLRGKPVDADLYVEPGDPEIVALTSQITEFVHTGADSAVAVKVGDEFGKGRPGGESWMDKIPADEIVPGLVFRVRSSRGNVYQVRVDELPSGKNSMILSIRPFL